jgi:predicted ATPase
MGTIENAPASKSVISSSGDSVTQTGTFVLNGEYWTVGRGATTFSLKNVLGLGYIYCLLKSPGEEFYALDLEAGDVSSAAPSAVRSGARMPRDDWDFSIHRSEDAGPILDAQAKQEYKRRILELKEELEELREKGDYERAEKVESEIESIAQQLAQAVGLGGRDRRAGSTAERARLNVSRAIRAAIQKISEHDVSLGEFFGARIRTGSFCSFVPNPRVPIDWKLTLETPEPTISSGKPPPATVKSEANFIQQAAYRTIFVGREEERAILRRCLEQAKNSEGRIVFIAGPPGIGKTRTSRVTGEEARQQGFTALAGNCYDREDSVPFIPFVEILEVALEHAPSITELLGAQAAELTRLLPQLHRLLPNLPAPTEASPEQSRRLLFNAILELIARQSTLGPLLLLLEDLHWADEGSLSLLVHLGHSISKMPVVILATHRNDDIDMNPLLTRALEELTRLRVVERIQLRGLPQGAVANMIEIVSGQEPSPALVDLIYSNSDGNPLFVEELIAHLEQGRSDPDFLGMLEQGEIDLPHSLRLVVGRRLRLVSKDTMRVLGTAALIGRSFTFSLLEAATHTDPDRLIDSVEEAEKAALISSRLQYPEARFKFAHELIRRAVLDEVSVARRQRLHLNIAEAIEALYSNAIEEHAEDLAHHFWSAGAAADPAKAILYLQMAGEKAARSSANMEATRHFSKALQLIHSLPGTPEQLRQELLLQTALGTALIATKGFSSKEVEEVYARARELSERVGETPQQFFHVLFGLWLSHASRGQYEMAVELGRQCLRVAESAGDVDLVLEAHHALGTSLICVGNHESALEHLERTVAIYDPKQHGAHAQIYGHDPAVVCLMHASWALWLLGRPEQALQKCNESLAFARKLAHPSTSATVQAFLSCLQQWCGNVPEVEQSSASAIVISNEHDFAYYRAMATVLAGWALVQRQQTTEGIEQMRGGLAAFQAMGGVLLSSYFSGLLAEAYALAGNAEEALNILGRVENDREPWWKAELYRLKGELILRQYELHRVRTPDEDQAEQYFRQAVTIARAQKAKSLELRVATSLSRLLLKQSKRFDARLALSEIVGQFTEGLDTRDLREAQALLRRL